MIPPVKAGLRLISLAVTVLAAACEDSTPVDPEFLATTSAATSLAAVAISHSQIDLTWQDDARNEGGWEVHRSTTGPAGAFSFHMGRPPNTSSASDYELRGNTQYCYKVRSLRLTGRGRTMYGGFSNVACATTPAAPVPAAPSGLSTAPRCCFLIDVTWTDNSTDETEFRVHRAPSSSGPWSVVGGTWANTTSLTDYVSPEQTFCHRVVAANLLGESGPSNVDCTAIPATPTNLTAAVSGSAVDLMWTDNSSLEDGYQVERSPVGAPGSVIATLPPNTTSYRDAGVTANNTYTYTVRATRDGGTSANSQYVQVIVATSPPNPPTNLQATPQTSSSVWVSWSDGSTNEQGFRLQRSTNGGGTWTTVSTTGTAYASDLGLSPEVQICYRVVAFNNVGDSPPSNTDCTTPPAGPTGFTATGVNAETVDFAWTDNSAIEDGYEVWLFDCSYYYYCYNYVIATLGANATSYRYQNPYAYWYSYAVVARKDGGYSDQSGYAYPTAPPSGSPARGAKP